MNGSGAVAHADTKRESRVQRNPGEQLLAERPWQTVVWDDPVNLMSYVSYVFRTHFGFDQAHAQRLMMQVHNQGSAVVAEGPRREMEMHVEALHGYGLWATFREAGQ